MSDKKCCPISKPFCKAVAWAKGLSPRQISLVVFLFGVFLIVSAFTIEYGFHARPCHLCWLQRYGHWVLTAIALVGALVPFLTWPALVGVILAGFYGLGMGIYQVLVQYKFLPAPQGCSSANLDIATDINDFMAALKQPMMAPACDKIDFTIWGITLAGWNAIVMTVMLVVLFKLICNLRQKAKESA